MTGNPQNDGVLITGQQHWLTVTDRALQHRLQCKLPPISRVASKFRQIKNYIITVLW